MSIQRGIQKYGDKGKNSAIKEIKNLTIKNDCFGEIYYRSITQEMKDKALCIANIYGDEEKWRIEITRMCEW